MFICKDDFYQNSAPGVTAKQGPRQPWQVLTRGVSQSGAKTAMAGINQGWQPVRDQDSHDRY